MAALDREAQTGGPQAPFAAATAAVLRTKSPTSVTVALEQVRRGKAWTFEQCMQVEYRLASRLVREPDFLEGVRAVIYDKDNRPRWRPAELTQVRASDVERYFSPLPDGEWVAP